MASISVTIIDGVAYIREETFFNVVSAVKNVINTRRIISSDPATLVEYEEKAIEKEGKILSFCEDYEARRDIISAFADSQKVPHPPTNKTIEL